MKALSHHLNLNTLILLALSGFAWYSWHDIQAKLETVPVLVTNVAVISTKVDGLEKNCVTEARINDLLARARAPKANSPRTTE